MNIFRMIDDYHDCQAFAEQHEVPLVRTSCGWKFPDPVDECLFKISRPPPTKIED